MQDEVQGVMLKNCSIVWRPISAKIGAAGNLFAVTINRYKIRKYNRDDSNPFLRRITMADDQVNGANHFDLESLRQTLLSNSTKKRSAELNTLTERISQKGSLVETTGHIVDEL